MVDHEELLRLAHQVRAHAYVPYSRFAVGAALLGTDGQVHLGCNVENGAYSPSNCAERTALHRAIADGVKPGDFRAIAVVGDTPGPITPCGVCRQVLSELCPPDMPVVMSNLHGDVKIMSVAELLPGAFAFPSESERKQD